MPHEASRLWRFLYALVTLIKPLFCRLRIEGREKMPATGGCVLACNHTLGPDYVLLAYASPRQVYFMAKTEIFGWHPLIARLLTTVGTFPVERGKGDVAAMNTAVDVVRDGRVLGMFPEGTRSRSGVLMRGKTGAARIAMNAGAPVVPAVVINSPQIFKQLFRFGRRPEVTICFGDPLAMPGDPNDPAQVRANTERVMYAMAALLPPALRGAYGQNEPAQHEL